MTDDPVDLALADLESALDVTPSAHFETRVRARIAIAPVRPVWRGIVWPVAVAGVVAVVVAMLVVRRSPEVVATPIATTTRVTPVAPAPGVVTLPEPARSLPAATSAARGASVMASAASPAAVPPSEPVLEVITNQGDVLRNVWRRAHSGSSDLQAVDAEPAAETPRDEAIVLPEVTIAPIVIHAMETSTSGAAGSGGSGIRRAMTGRH